MKSAQELYDEWTDGESNGMRPKRVQMLRNDIQAATGLVIPKRVTQIEGWLERMIQSGVMTKKLRAAAEGSDVDDVDADPEDDDADDE